MPKRSDILFRNLKQISKGSSKSLRAIITLLISGFLAGVAFEEFVGIGTWHSYAPPTDKINVCFTPPSGCGALIVQQISRAEKSIYVQAFNFYSEPIASALIKAKKRGVDVRIILDKTNNDNAKSQARRVIQEGVEVAIDPVAGIAHNKVMIIDRQKVITGSFNFSDSADTRNAENVLLIDDPEMAKGYLRNWMDRRTEAHKMGLSNDLCKFSFRQLDFPFKFDHEVSHGHVPILDEHSPFSRNILNCQVQDFKDSFVIRKNSLVFGYPA